MTDLAWLARQFEDKRAHLRDVAYRMLGSHGEAEDAVQETWLRLARSDAAGLENLGGWLTTVTARVCLDMLRARKIRQTYAAESRAAAGPAVVDDASREEWVADSVAVAMLVVLESLSPAERVAFVLHDMFDLSYDEIGRVLDRSGAAARQLASRARRRVQRRDPDPEAARAARSVVDAFLAASREGNFEALLAVLDPGVIVRADADAVRVAAATKWAGTLAAETRGAEAVASLFKGRAGGASRATIDGEPGAVWAVRGQVRAAFVFTVEDGRVIALDLVMAPDAIAELAIDVLTSDASRPPGGSRH